MLVYVTERCSEQVDATQDSGVRERVEELVAKLGTAANRWDADKLWQFRDRGYQKQRIGKWRLLGRFVNSGEETVCVLLALLARGSDEYEKDFLRDRRFEVIERGLSPDVLSRWVREKQSAVSSTEVVRVPDALDKWLQVPTEIAPEWGGGDVMVFESEDWVRQSADINIRNRYESLSELLLSLVESSHGEQAERWYAAQHPRGTVGVVYCRPAPSVLYLTHVGSQERDQLSEIARGCPAVPDDYKRKSRRAYPAYILADLDLWSQIQAGETSNLSLSPEEFDLLRSMGSSGSEGHALPMFINGRAGSGKSTMLMYAFAGLYRRRDANGLGGTPLFITYSPGLKEKARLGVERLLRTNHQFLQQELDLTDLDSCFLEFQAFLLGFLSPEERERFSLGRRVVYNDFKSAYLGKEGRLRRFMAARPRGVSPEIAWFVIRSLIKGATGTDGDLDLEGFDNLDRKDRVVTSEIFQSVLHEVYESWYRPRMEEAGLWDDQDLVAAALSSGRPAPREVAAIVCDEAQDFTKRELRLLIGSCALSRYDLSNYGARVRMPFVLAGDPLQTISPTGFRWEQFTSAMYEDVRVFAADAAGTPFFKELTLNYRSTAEIVLVANAVQQLRMEWLKLPGIEPQEPWVDRGDDSPKCLVIGSGISAQQFDELTKDAVIIVPCEESGEAEFVRNDPVLSQLYERATSESSLYNVFSSSSAKGLEFPRVIVYGFGEALPDRPARFEELDPDDDSLFQLKHFFNKLYVAVTRAERQLYIVDSPDGYRKLWEYLSPQNVSARIRNTGFYEKAEGLLLGTSVDLDSIADANPLENAEKLEAAGRANRIPTQLRQAAGYYRRANRNEKARRCEAEAKKYEGHFAEAGEIFRELGDGREAWSCFWRARDWAQLAEIQGLSPVGPPDQWRAVQYMLGSGRLEADALGVAGDVVSNAAELGRSEFRSSSWSVVADEIVKHATENPPREGRAVVELAQALGTLASYGSDTAGVVAGDLYYSIGEWSAANEVWEMCGHTDSRKATRAKAHSLGFPQGLQLLDQAGAHQEMVELWESSGRPESRAWLSFLGVALQKTRRHGDAAEVLMNLGEYGEAMDLLDKLVTENHERTATIRIRLAEHAGRSRDLRMMKQLIGPRCYSRNAPVSEKNEVIETMIGSLVLQAIGDDLWQKKADDPNLSQFLKDEIGGWNNGCHPMILGAAIETCGRFVDTLRFYEGYTDADDAQLALAARMRWLSVKMRQLDSLEKESVDWRRQEQIRRKNLKDWGINERNLSIPPVPPVKSLLKKIGDARPSTSQVADLSVAGTEAELSWNLADRRLQLSWSDDSVFSAVRIDFDAREVVPAGSVIEREPTVAVVLGPARVVIDFESSTITVERPSGGEFRGRVPHR